MPHSRTGRKVEVGDIVVTTYYYEGKLISSTGGTVLSINESESCNATVMPFGTPVQYVTLKDCLHVEDIAELKPA